MSDPWCANCGHSDHQDVLQGNFCYKVTREGLCGCESWSEAWACEDCNREPCECRMGDDMDLTSDPLPSAIEGRDA